MKIKNKRNLLCSNDNLNTGYSYAKYNITIVKWNALKIEIKKCSVDDITVYKCICSDDIGGKNYQDQIDLRHFFSSDGNGKFNMSGQLAFFFLYGKFKPKISLLTIHV